MKLTKFILVALIGSLLLSSCNAPLLKRTLALPGRMISTVTGPILGGFGL